MTFVNLSLRSMTYISMNENEGRRTLCDNKICVRVKMLERG